MEAGGLFIANVSITALMNVIFSHVNGGDIFPFNGLIDVETEMGNR